MNFLGIPFNLPFWKNWTPNQSSGNAGSDLNAFKARVLADGGTFEADRCFVAEDTYLRLIPTGSSNAWEDAGLIMTANAYKATVIYCAVPTDGSGDFTVSRASSAYRVDADGDYEYMSSNVPRLDYLLGACPSWLLEPSKTNIILQSQDFSSGSWAKVNSSVSPNTTTAPDGTTTADTITLNAVNDARVQQVFALAANTRYSITCHFKNIALTSGQVFTWRINNGQVAPNDFQMKAIIDLADGTAVFSQLGTAGTGIIGTVVGEINPLNDGWYEVTVTGVTGSGAATATAGNQIILEAGQASVSKSFYAWQSQVETGYATSPIITTTTTVTRAADSISQTSLQSIGALGSTEGTIVFEAMSLGALDATIFNFNDSGSSSQFNLFINSSNEFVFRDGTTTMGAVISGASMIKFAVAYNGTNVKVYANGAQVGSDYTLGGAWSAIDEIVSANGGGVLLDNILMYDTQLGAEVTQ